MSTGNLIRGFRKYIIEYNFSANGELSWSEKANGNGEIYGAELTNIDSYTINGASPSFPISVTNGNDITVAISKTNGGQVANVKLLTRRSVDETKAINVPDYGTFNGGYLYAITKNNRLFKIDGTLLNSSNYQGSGVWTTNPVTEISLPTVPFSGYLYTCEFVVKDGEPLLFIHGQNTSEGQDYACYLRINTDEIYNIQLTSKDTWTNMTSEFPNIAFRHVTTPKCMYDYIGNKIYLFSNQYHDVQVIDINDPIDGSYTAAHGEVLHPDYCLSTEAQSMLIKTNGRFCGGIDAEIGTGKSFAYKVAPTTNKEFATTFDGKVIRGTTSQFYLYDLDGVILGTISKNSLGSISYASYSCKYNDVENKALTTGKYGSYNNRYTFWELDESPAITLPDQVLQTANVAAGQTYVNMPTYISGNMWACKGADGDGIYRLVMLDSTIQPSDYAYLDLPDDIIYIKSNRYDK